jgi:hypothetical protein
MDSLTHIYFAEKLLRACGLDPAAAVASLYPQIDRSPAYFHRMYGHPFYNIARLRDTAIAVTCDRPAPDDPSMAYAAKRYAEERPRMEGFARQFARETGAQSGAPSDDPLSVTIAWASHTYQDIFNNPMQAFLPQVSYPCGKWAFWESLPHPVEFRLHLYDAMSIAAFRAEFFADPIWDRSLEPRALAWGMVDFTRRAAAIELGSGVTEAAFAALDIGAAPTAEDLANVEGFLQQHERLLERLIAKYARRGEGRPAEAGAPLFPVGS